MAAGGRIWRWQNAAIQPVAFPIVSEKLGATWAQNPRLHPSDETVFDGHTCRCLSFFPPPAEDGDLGKGATSPPSPEKFVAHIRHRSKNTSVALAEFSANPGNAVCCSNSSGER
jgi:hypothetical protein